MFTASPKFKRDGKQTPRERPEAAMRVLVCGGRDYNDRERVFAELDHIDSGKSVIKAVIHGDARGADILADEWARERGVHVDAFPADWNKHGKRAGPIRNAEMLRDGMVDLVLAFPGGRGTAHMVSISRAACVPVVEVK